jgi:hypothetical protein
MRRKLGRPGRGLKDDIEMEVKEQKKNDRVGNSLASYSRDPGSNLTHIWVILHE